jgi:signal transduction histidine kinase
VRTRDVTRQPLPGRPGAGWSVDATLALAVGVIQIVATTFAAERQSGREPLDILGYALLAAGPVALLARRSHPVPVLGVAFVATLSYWLAGYPRGPVFLALIVAFVTAVMAGYRTLAWLSIAVGYVSAIWLADLLGTEPTPGPGQAAALAAWLLVLVAAAEVLRVRRERAAEAARSREEQARRRAGEERLRIARELHDVLAHNISLINVQAGVALHLIDERPEQARGALSAIKDASKEALGELRSVLNVLRQTDERPPRSPTAGLARLDELVSRATAAGLEVRTEVDGSPRPLAARVDLAAFRIVQEALTNVVRHAGPATATVRLAYGERELTLQVEDDGRGWTANGTTGGGSGIAGMRERAIALGGTLDAGARPGGGFRVRARLPLDGTA